MRFVLDLTERSPLYRQLEDQIRYAISVGELSPGDPLPSIRELEAELDVNRNTVRRAYLDLEAEGLLVLRQGREARVAPRRLSAARGDAAQQSEAADDLATLLLQRAESEGLDGLHVAEHLAQIARQHDRRYPKWVFLECSRRQADYLAAQAERLLGRRVVGVELHALREDASVLPASVRHAVTPHWHAGEARELLRPLGLDVFAIRVEISGECQGLLRGLQGRSIGLAVRDAESAPGFGDALRQHIGAATVRVVLAGDASGLAALASAVDALVYTTPCAEAVRAVAPAGLPVHELVFEPTPEDVRAVRDEVFPDLKRRLQLA